MFTINDPFLRVQDTFSKDQVLSGGSWLRSFQFTFLTQYEFEGRVLDLGGGNGRFLRWATREKKKITSLEVLDGFNKEAEHQLDPPQGLGTSI